MVKTIVKATFYFNFKLKNLFYMHSQFNVQYLLHIQYN